jgi:mono/diheme cytochrome c family protein
MSRVFSRTGWGFLLAALASALAVADEPKSAEDPAALEFFEAKVRPILVEKCQSCHNAEKLKGGLRLDSREAAVAGGPTGPAVVPGKPDQSLLVDAINYGELKMPPRSKLAPDEIATLTRWVESGTGPALEPATGRPPRSSPGSRHRVVARPDRPVPAREARGQGDPSRGRSQQDRPDPPPDLRPHRPAANARRGGGLPRRSFAGRL